MKIEIEKSVIDDTELKVILKVTQSLKDLDTSVWGSNGDRRDRYNSVIDLVVDRLATKLCSIALERYEEEILNRIDLDKIVKGIHFHLTKKLMSN